MKHEIGRITKGNIKFIEYGSVDNIHVDKYYLQCGIAGILADEQELKDICTLLNYYFNIEEFTKCKIQIEGEDVAIS